MILPVVAYGSPILRKVCDVVSPEQADLQSFIASMWDTMYHSNGVGLAAPQVNKPLRLFVVDTLQIVEGFDDDDRKKYPGEIAVKQVFINAQVLEESGDTWAYNEGCLSIPKIREDITRLGRVRIRYQDEQFAMHEEEYFGIAARVIQHEYDHIEGKLFIDYLTPLKKRLIKKKLDDITNGKVKTDYRMLFPKPTR